MFGKMRNLFEYLVFWIDWEARKRMKVEVQAEMAMSAVEARYKNDFANASHVVGAQLQLVDELERLTTQRNKLEEEARQALNLASKAVDEAQASEFRDAARGAALEMASIQQRINDLKVQIEASQQMVEMAKLAARQSKLALDKAQTDKKAVISRAKTAKLTQGMADRLAGIGPGADPFEKLLAESDEQAARAKGALALASQDSGLTRLKVQAAMRDAAADDILAQLGGKPTTPAITAGDPNTLTGELAGEARQKDNA